MDYKYVYFLDPALSSALPVSLRIKHRTRAQCVFHAHSLRALFLLKSYARFRTTENRIRVRQTALAGTVIDRRLVKKKYKLNYDTKKEINKSINN